MLIRSTSNGFRYVMGTILSAAFFAIILILPHSSSYALVDDDEPFDPRRIPVEMQSWWSPNFGHIHAATRLPLGQVVSGRLDFDVRIVLHNNPSHLTELRIDVDGDHTRIRLDFDCPYDGVTESTCAYNVPVSLDTTEMRDGWREFRIRATTETPDGKRFLNSSGIPINVQNGGPDHDYDRWCNNTSLIGRGWYEGFDYANAIIECVPLEPVSGVHTFRVRAQKSSAHLTVALDRTHFIPAVGPWPAQQASTGQILFDEDGDFGSFFPITIDTRQLPDGWHTLAVTSTSPDRGTSECPFCQGEINKQKGVAKLWFYVQNGSASAPTTSVPLPPDGSVSPPASTSPPAPTTETTPGSAATTETTPGSAATTPATTGTSPPPVGDGVCPTGPMPFVDVSVTSFAFEDIACIFGLGITTGTSATTYSPDDLVTREQLAAFVARTVRAMHLKCPTGPMPFVDVSVTSFAFEDIACIFGLGITTGTSATTYSPDDLVTREQVAAFLARTIRVWAKLNSQSGSSTN